MNDREKTTIARILKVNHAGEYGAIRIYRSQLLVARWLFPDIVEFLSVTLTHEINHCARFREAMPQRAAKPCRIMPLWGSGGLILGFATALLGRQGIWICTKSVEATVHLHLEEQLLFLEQKDPELHSLIASIQQDEQAHLHYAEERVLVETLGSRLLTRFISMATNGAIYLSTWGDSARMAKDLYSAKH